ncbi:MAG: hypothetical protein NZM06_01375 [Chloroherpetonaceae bacterium]|nr:hypothetical protein [Chloroherpetonaceae bacterium]MDW8436685.1 hypothetical protein [Chloroherpetonaceae bacterium]
MNCASGAIECVFFATMTGNLIAMTRWTPRRKIKKPILRWAFSFRGKPAL